MLPVFQSAPIISHLSFLLSCSRGGIGLLLSRQTPTLRLLSVSGYTFPWCLNLWAFK